jgi:hypothetical protein
VIIWLIEDVLRATIRIKVHSYLIVKGYGKDSTPYLAIMKNYGNGNGICKI